MYERTQRTGYYPRQKFTRPINEILKLQSKGELITAEEKEVIKRYAKNQRVRNKK